MTPPRTAAATLEHYDAVEKATIEMLSSTCGLALTETDDHSCLTDTGAILGIISLMGDVDWGVCIGMPKETASALAELFAGFAIPFESDDMSDCIGELSNILAGTIQRTLNARGLKADISLPSVMRGQKLDVCTSACTTVFDSDSGKLWVSAFGETADPAQAAAGHEASAASSDNDAALQELQASLTVLEAENAEIREKIQKIAKLAKA